MAKIDPKRAWLETHFLNLEESGLYFKALCYTWRTGAELPDDDKSAAKLLRLDPRNYARVMARLIEYRVMVRHGGMVVRRSEVSANGGSHARA
jgi:uncharacterized protein YdaU (DUF1376 family)